MDHRSRSRMGVGVLLVVLGVAWLVVQLVPGLRGLLDIPFAWPLVTVMVGGGLLVLGLVIGAPDMAVPACVVAGIGGILYWQNMTGNWASWAYIWTLIPGFVGVGIILAGLLKGELGPALHEGAGALFASLVLFLIFGSFFGALGFLGDYWPVLLIVLGVLILVRGFIRPRR
ncbi:MAG: hypothetical protein JXD18_01960 [Anaerolineae bacterium]|nr:hypothetical protein [Anaerolineae bacterium]